MSDVEEQAQPRVWPPPVYADALGFQEKRPLWRRASLWLAGAAVMCWAGGATGTEVLYAARHDAPMDAGPPLLGNTALVAGPVCALCGVWLGVREWKAQGGRTGLSLSLLVLGVMAAFLLGFRFVFGHWVWLTLWSAAMPL